MEKKRIVQEGDLVILYERYDRTTAIYVKAGESFQNQLGSFMHNDMIGKPYGSLVWPLSECKSYWTRSVLRPTDGFTCWLPIHSSGLRLWRLELRSSSPWTRVWSLWTSTSNREVESSNLVFFAFSIDLIGTGSGALSTAFAQCIYPDGHLWTYEYNKYRVEDAKYFPSFFYIVYFCHRKEFKNNKLDSIITIAYRDVYADGLECKLEDVDNNKELYDRGKKVDAVFLDLPKPWCGILLFSVPIPIAIQSAFQCLRKGGRICCFSPCIEQVQKSCEMLREVGFDCMPFWVLGLPE